MAEDQHEDVLLTMSTVDKLAADFWEDFQAFLDPRRSSTVSWVKMGEDYRDQMEPQQFLAWAWTKRRVLLTDQFRRECERKSMAERKRATNGDNSPELVESVLAGLTNGSAERQDKIEQARLTFHGRLAKHFDVPGKGSMPLGLMESDDLTAAERGLGGQASELMREKRFLARIKRQLPAGAKVHEHFTEDQINSMWSTLAAIVR